MNSYRGHSIVLDIVKRPESSRTAYAYLLWWRESCECDSIGYVSCYLFTTITNSYGLQGLK